MKLVGNILKAELRTIRNIWDWAGDISKEKDYVNTELEKILEQIGSPLNLDSLILFIKGRGG